MLEDLIVHREYRRQSFGTQLLNYAIDFAKKKKFLRITLLTDKPNEKLQRFFAKERICREQHDSDADVLSCE